MKINRTAYRTIEMLQVISNYPDGISLKDIVIEMDIPRTSAFDILQSLLLSKMVNEIDGSTKTYTIGLKAFEIGSTYLKKANLVNVISPMLKELANDTKRTSFFGVLDDTKVMYLYKYEPHNAIVTNSIMGTKNEIYCTALGKSILANIKYDEAKNLVDRMDFEKKTDRTITDPDKFLEELDKVKAKGYAVDDREFEDYIACFSAPVFNYTGDVIGAISISGLYTESIDEAQLGNKVKMTANEISKKLGYSKVY